MAENEDAAPYERLPLSVTRTHKDRLRAEATRHGDSVSAIARHIFTLYFDIMDGRLAVYVPPRTDRPPE